MTIDADPERLGEARDWAYRAASRAGLGDADCYQVKLAVSEAVANAIQHGSRGRGDQIGIAAFRDEVLSQGDSRDPMALFVSFMGREPRVDALLERQGLLG